MKRNILISVLFGLVLVFGVLVASCDNGVLPPPPNDPKNIEVELNGRPQDPAPDTYYADFYNNVSGAVGGDGFADYPFITLTEDDAPDVLYDPTDGVSYEVTCAPVALTNGYYTGKMSLKATRGSPAVAD